MNDLLISRRRLMQAAPVLAATGATGRARAGEPVQMLSHRGPNLEYLAGKMRTAIPGVEVNTQLMPFDKALELATIAFSSKSDTPDLVYANDSTMLIFAKNGWIRPLDDLWAKHREEFALDDFPKPIQDEASFQGHIWRVPATSNAMLFFYRKDLFDAAARRRRKPSSSTAIWRNRSTPRCVQARSVACVPSMRR